MKTGIGRFGVLSAVAAMAALVAAPMPAMAAGGGTITFTGMIVAPQLEVSAAPAPAQAGARVNAAGGRLAAAGSAVTLTFSTEPGVVAGANVALQVINGAKARDALAERFVDGSGHVFRAASDGRYRVGRDGGVLSLASKNAAQETQVIVVVSYD
ncbi:hypothetical protein GNZ12_08565 [Paraburkholderia sp. 1N]|uniref:Uncharacterized protein n=1 Tax=Paraburkholderia solitsugae TaxID=2675748 RepID=A0ABX2BNE6_9BURK|nr:hypothetical protein [Paraburkholderia solitsugae]NPT41368.1 hypothetical protein [Paraburkholderia solitsugae]